MARKKINNDAAIAWQFQRYAVKKQFGKEWFKAYEIAKNRAHNSRLKQLKTRTP